MRTRDFSKKRQAFFNRAYSDSKGTSAIEFAIIAPVFLTLVFGIIVYGYYFATLSLVNHIAYESARATVAGLTDDERGTLAHMRADELIAEFGTFLGSGAVEVDAGTAGNGIYAVTVHHQFDAFHLIGSSSLLPLPPTDQTATVQISHGGY